MTLVTSSDDRFLINTGSGQLEQMTPEGQAFFDKTRGDDEGLSDWSAIVYHPHPVHGGTMDNQVVTTLARTAREAGLDSLRFNKLTEKFIGLKVWSHPWSIICRTLSAKTSLRMRLRRELLPN